LEVLKIEFGDSFAEVVALDQDLKQAGIQIQPLQLQVDAAKAWLGEYKRWVLHHEADLSWASNPDGKMSLEEILLRIKSGETSASSLRASAEKLDAELKKLI
jgi:hypothetical protein